jgi:DNA-directed RNA polymerase specialized sigma24 family protein
VTPSDGAGRSADPELLLRDQRWLVALARSLVGDEQAVEDVVQEARIAAWLHAPGDPSRAGGWLRRVVRNLSIRVRRSDARRLAREQASAPREATPGRTSRRARRDAEPWPRPCSRSTSPTAAILLRSSRLPAAARHRGAIGAGRDRGRG